jgi:hypothetical protein
MTVYKRRNRYWMDTVIDVSDTACHWRQQTGRRHAVRQPHW